MSIVTIDLGASNTRCTTDNGVITIVPNNMVFLPTLDPSLIEPESNSLDSSLEIVIRKKGNNDTGYFPCNVLVGLMADKHRNINERPSVNNHKHNQKINYISAVIGCAINKIKYPYIVGDDIHLYLATPPTEVLIAQPVFKNVLVGEYTVTFTKFENSRTVTFNIVDVSCEAESHMATTSFFFNMNGTLKEENKEYLKGNVLSLDIGASTTDLAIIENGHYLDKSGLTYRIGGNVARDNLIDLICQRFAFDLPIEAAEKVMKEGRLQQGNTFVDVSDLVGIAKADLAKQLTTYMQTYFKRVGIPIQLINSIVVSGGGSVQSQYITDDDKVIKTSEPMSFYVTQELLSWSPGTEVVQYGEDARLANVKGLYIKAKLEQLRKLKRAADSQAQDERPANTLGKVGQLVQPAIANVANAVASQQNIPTV